MKTGIFTTLMQRSTEKLLHYANNQTIDTIIINNKHNMACNTERK